MKIVWSQYREGMPVVDHFVRVLGSSKDYNEAVNAADTRRICKLPGGLTGFVEGLHGNTGAVVVFRKDHDQNSYLWKSIPGLTPENLDTGYLKVFLNTSRWRGMEFGDFEPIKMRNLSDADKLKPSHDWTAMGVRG